MLGCSRKSLWNRKLIRNAHMKVDVFDHDGNFIRTYPIQLTGLNYIPSEREFIDEAKKCILEDELADEREIEKFQFRLRHDIE